MKRKIDTMTQRNVVLLPIAAARHDAIDWTGGCGPAAATTTPQHVAAQDMADNFGLCPVNEYAYDYPGDDHGGDSAPFTVAGPKDFSSYPRNNENQRLVACWQQALDDMGITAADLPYTAVEPAEWYGPFLVRGQDGSGIHEVTRMVMLAAHRQDGVGTYNGKPVNDGELLVVSMWLAIPESQLLLSDARGRYIPRDFVQDCLCLTRDTDRDSTAGPLRGVEPTDDGTAMCEWVPGEYRYDVNDNSRKPEPGHVLDFYMDADVDSLWRFDGHILSACYDCLDPEGEYYWESWQTLEERLRARLQVTGVLCDGSEDMAEYDGSLIQEGDLWLVFAPHR